MFSARRKMIPVIVLSGTKKIALHLQTPFELEQRHEEESGELELMTNFTNREPRNANDLFKPRFHRTKSLAIHNDIG